MMMKILSILFMATMTSSMEITSCVDMQMAFDVAKEHYVNAPLHPFADIHCDNLTTFSLGSGYDIDVFSTDNLDNFYGNANFVNVRLEIVNGSKITFEPNILFENYDEEDPVYHDVNGGALFIGKDSTVRFLNKFDTKNIGVRSETAESSDFADHQNDGGCIFNQGYFRVDGSAVMTGCENSGGGEGSPGRGGAIFNDVTGSVRFERIEISDVSITDDEGNLGGAIYNLGKVNVNGDSAFSNLRAEGGGAIYNGNNAVFNFRKGASVLFYGCKAFDSNAGAVLNNGIFKFSGPAVFVDGQGSGYKGSQITIGSEGTMKLSDNSYFFRNGGGAPIYVEEGGELKYDEEMVSFVSNDFGYQKEECVSVYFEDGEVCV